MHEWLFAVPYDLLLTRSGPHAFALVAAFGCLATLTPVLAMIARGRHPLTILLSTLLCTTLFELRMITPRPPHVALALATATAWLAFRERFGWKHTAAAGVLGLIWANAHGSFIVGVGLLAAGVLAGDGQRRERVLAVVVFALATLINPYGLRLHALVLSYLLGTGDVIPMVHANVTEFSPVIKALREGYLDPVRLAGLVAVIALAIWALTRPGMRIRGLVALVLCAMTLLQLRHLEMAGLVGTMLLVPAFDALFDRTASRPRTDTLLERSLPFSLALLATAAIAAHLAVNAARAPDDWVNENLGSRDVPALIAALPDGTRLHATFVQTGVAIWYGAPRGIRMLFDLRNDCYGHDAAVDALTLQKPPPGSPLPLAVLARRHVDAVIVRESHPLAVTLSHAPGWRVRERRHDWISFAPIHAPGS
jgi:hypothetical protein